MRQLDAKLWIDTGPGLEEAFVIRAPAVSPGHREESAMNVASMSFANTNVINTAAVDSDELAVLTTEISDEALEAAACAGPQQGGVFTVSMCTGLQECPF